MPNYDYYCNTCDSTTIESFRIAEKPDTITCACGGTAKFRISTPMILKESYLDGQRRFSDLKESAKLDRARREARSSETKKEIAAEIRKLGGKTSES